MDTSDEMRDVVMEDFFAGADPGTVPEMQDPQPSTSGRGMTPQLAIEPPKGPSCAEQAIQDACAAKAWMTPMKGNRGCNIESYIHSAYVDEEYLVIGSHVDESICKKIINHEYVDFCKIAAPRPFVSGRGHLDGIS